jgi:hypothetical protein
MTTTDRYTKLPVTISAKQYTGGFDNAQQIMDWVDADEQKRERRGRHSWSYSSSLHDGDRFYIQTLEGQMEVVLGDYVIIGVEGEVYPCKPQIFAQTYRAGGGRKRWTDHWLLHFTAGLAAGGVAVDVLWRLGL